MSLLECEAAVHCVYNILRTNNNLVSLIANIIRLKEWEGGPQLIVTYHLLKFEYVNLFLSIVSVDAVSIQYRFLFMGVGSFHDSEDWLVVLKK